MRKILLATVLALTLSACGTTGPTLELTVAEIPPSMLKCIPAPYRDKPFIKINDKQASFLLARYKTAHADCYDKLGSVRSLYAKWKIEQAKKKA